MRDNLIERFPNRVVHPSPLRGLVHHGRSAETAMIKNALSNTQIDLLGNRLKGGSHTESDLRLLDDYRRSFGAAYEAVVRTLRQRGAVPTGRLAKSTKSIAEKLRRESIRLSQMQDIAGCRIVVENILDQEKLVASLKADFPEAILIDRRDNPSHGYRAVHLIAEISGKPIEIQIRSSLQHLWAEVSEKSSDVLDPTIKYGGGSDSWREGLTKSSQSVAAYEESEKKIAVAVASEEAADAAYKTFENAYAEPRMHHLPDHKLQEMQKAREDLMSKKKLRERTHQKLRGDSERLRKKNTDLLTEAITWLDRQKRQKQ